MKVLVIDGQGGKMGREIIESLLLSDKELEITAVGTNSMATANMIKGGAVQAATGENAVIVGARRADVIVGPMAIVIADSLLGEITPAMAVAVGQSSAKKVLIPVSRCGTVIAGASGSTGELIKKAVEEIIKL